MTNHEAAQDYWRRATDTFIADDEYYKRVAAAVTQYVLPGLSASVRVLDIGCGDGKYTAILASSGARVDAYDLSPALIRAAEQRDLPNVAFRVGDATAPADSGTYDAVSCMGVLVCLVEDTSFRRALAAAAAKVRPGGTLVLRETTSGWGRRVHHDGSYIACYRQRRDYLEPLAPEFKLEADVRLAVWSRVSRRSNHLWVLRRPI